MNLFRDELKSYDTATATIRFSADKPLPESLVKKIVKARIEENEAKKKSYQSNMWMMYLILWNTLLRGLSELMNNDKVNL